MIFQPRAGQLVTVHYSKERAAFMPYHGRDGVIEAVSRGKGPRNVLVKVGDDLVIIPRGNLKAR